PGESSAWKADFSCCCLRAFRVEKNMKPISTAKRIKISGPTVGVSSHVEQIPGQSRRSGPHGPNAPRHRRFGTASREQGAGRARHPETEMRPRFGCRDATARGAGDEALSDQERLRDGLDGLGLLAHGHGERREADGPPAEADAERSKDCTVEPVE